MNGLASMGGDILETLNRWSGGIIVMGIVAGMVSIWNVTVTLTEVQRDLASLQNRLSDPRACLPGAVCRIEYEPRMVDVFNRLDRLAKRLEAVETD